MTLNCCYGNDIYYDVQNGENDHEHDDADDDGHDDDDSYEDNYQRGNYGVEFKNGIEDIDGDSEGHHDRWLCTTAPHSHTGLYRLC